MRLLLVPGLLLLALNFSCSRRHTVTTPTERQRQIARLQDFSQAKGTPRTGNFQRVDARKTAYFLCYSTGKWTLPDDYNGLRYKESNAFGCKIDPHKYDVYFHKVEAVAKVNAPVTRSLEEATDERALMVVAHEEAHEDPHLERLPSEVSEAATTLLGILTAAEFAEHDGDRVTATHLFEDARTFRRKAEAVNALHTTLRTLYSEFHARKRTLAETIAEKERLFDEHATKCKNFGRAYSINPCLPASNNAGLAFDHTYTRAYPRLYALFEACEYDTDTLRRELRELGDALAEGGKRRSDIHQVEEWIRERIAMLAPGRKAE